MHLDGNVHTYVLVCYVSARLSMEACSLRVVAKLVHRIRVPSTQCDCFVMNLICSIPNCGYLAEKNGICPRHNREARKASAPKEKPKRQRISKTADPEREKIYLAIRALFLAACRECEACAYSAGGYPHLAVDIHHKKGRTGDLLFDVRFFMPVCREHHKFIHDNPDYAYERGWSLSRHAAEPHVI